ncbi:MAG: response regulator transcription factor [Cellulosilyticaceae bacterium]
MIKVMIAEDELLVRSGLKYSIDWHALDMEVVADVDNGERAYQLFLEERPEIIITDLRMPKMDGVALIQKIREIDQSCLIIVISCVEDFEVLRGMVAYNIFAYLSKALMSMKEINSVLEKAQRTLLHNQKCLRVVEKVSRADAIAENLISHLIEERMTIDEFVSCTQHLDAPNFVLIIHKEFIQDEATMQQRVIKSRALNDLVKSSVAGIRGTIYGMTDQQDLMFLDKQVVLSKEGLERDLVHMIETSRELFKAELKVIIMSLPDGWSQLKHQYIKNVKLINKFYFIEESILWESYSYKPEEPIQLLLTTIEQDSLEWVISQSDQAKYKHMIEEIVSICAQENRTHYKELIQDQLICLANLTNKHVKINSTEEMIQLQRQIMGTRTFFEAFKIYQTFVEKIKIHIKKQFLPKDEIVKALEYIHQNYNKEISLKSIATYVNLSPNYFSTLFKKEMGQSLVDYIMALKIERAKELLKSNLLFYQIAEEVGFSEETYFSKIFKVKTGMSPREWKLKCEKHIK